LDAAFNKILNSSGYLGVWRFEKNKNPWQYDLDLLIEENVADAFKLDYCMMLDAQAEEGLQRYEVNRAGYTLLVEETGLETFRTFLVLYETLVSLHQQRVRVARQWLQMKAPHLVPKSASLPVLIPHSGEWFEALKKQNPHQAAVTRTIIELAGQTDVCSICGDRPSKVYRLIGSELLVQPVNTFRLCSECWQIRRQQYAESPGLI
jgi:hypothetical protein